MPIIQDSPKRRRRRVRQPPGHEEAIIRAANQLVLQKGAKTATDYFRMRRNPFKRCRSCGQMYENTRDNFAMGRGGVLTSTCVACYEAPPVKFERVVELCPICGRRGKLVNDSVVSPPQKVCRGCLLAVNLVSSIVDQQGVNNWMEYFNYHQAWLGMKKDP